MFQCCGINFRGHRRSTSFRSFYQPAHHTVSWRKLAQLYANCVTIWIFCVSLLDCPIHAANQPLAGLHLHRCVVLRRGRRWMSSRTGVGPSWPPVLDPRPAASAASAAQQPKSLLPQRSYTSSHSSSYQHSWQPCWFLTSKGTTFTIMWNRKEYYLGSGNQIFWGIPPHLRISGVSLFCRSLQTVFRDFNATCIDLNIGKNCMKLTGYMAVYKISFSATFFFAIMGFVTMGVTSRSGYY